MKKDFLLTTKTAKILYKKVKDLPIIDYHNHLQIKDITEDRKFNNITELWITPDPYKHRAMRILGVKEKYITGDASDFEKFEAFYSCLPKLIGNALFDWSRMELSTVFGYELDFGVTAKEAYEKINERLTGCSARKILEKFNIEYSAPCASVCDDMSVYENMQTVAPSLRTDDIFSFTKSFTEKLSEVSEEKISDLSRFVSAIEKRLICAKAVGARYSDTSLDYGFVFDYSEEGASLAFDSLLSEGELSNKEKAQLRSYLLVKLARLYAKHGYVMQLHIGAKRETSSRLRQIAGPAGGYAAIGSTVDIGSLTALLDTAEGCEYGLPKTVLFTLNPKDNAVMAILSGSFSKDGVSSVVTQGPAWWWCDHASGILQMLSDFSAYSVLSSFIGMTTDSRSLLSFVRHDYFRRLLCKFIGEAVRDGLMPDDLSLLSDIAVRVCYENAKKTLI